MFGIVKPQSFIQITKSFPTTVTNFQTVRWRRKPRWLPVAKSKLFRVPPRTQTPVEEKVELKRLYDNYNTQMKALRSYLHGQYNIKSVIIDTEAHEREFLEDFQASCKINDEWNEKIRVEREARHKQKMDEEIEFVMKRIDEYNAEKKKMLETVEEIVRKEKEASKNFITPENIDAAIEHAINNPVDYNFSIDLQGNIYDGRKTKPEMKEQAANS